MGLVSRWGSFLGGARFRYARVASDLACVCVVFDLLFPGKKMSSEEEPTRETFYKELSECSSVKCYCHCYKHNNVDVNDLYLVWEKAGVLSGHWDSIAVMLGLSSDKIDEIEAASKPPKTCLRKVFDCWLRKDYDYKSLGVPTLRMLCNCIKSKSGGANPALADEIAREYLVGPTSSEEGQQKLTMSPTDDSSKGMSVCFIISLNNLNFSSYS